MIEHLRSPTNINLHKHAYSCSYTDTSACNWNLNARLNILPTIMLTIITQTTPALFSFQTYHDKLLEGRNLAVTTLYAYICTITIGAIVPVHPCIRFSSWYFNKPSSEAIIHIPQILVSTIYAITFVFVILQFVYLWRLLTVPVLGR
jgi:hypothetical protein